MFTMCLNSVVQSHATCSTVFFPQSLSKFSLVYLLAWHPPLLTPYISSTNHYLLFAAYAPTISTCFAVILTLCHLIPVSLSTLYLELYLVTSHHTSILPLLTAAVYLAWHMLLTAVSHCHAVNMTFSPHCPLIIISILVTLMFIFFISLLSLSLHR